MQVLSNADRFGAEPGGAPDWVEHLRAADLSVGTYSIPTGGVDTQDPHSEDEVYVVLRGRATFVAGDAVADVAPGTTIYVPSREAHRFEDIIEDLVAIVVFAPAEGTRPPG